MVAREAARLLYYKLAQEYKQAKEMAAKSLGIRVLPSNMEIGIALDELADDLEGSSRKELLIRLRIEALHIMESLRVYTPKLVGSVWRGTAMKGSDIDIIVFSSRPDSVVNQLITEYRVLRTQWTSKTDKGETNKYFHVFLPSSSGNDVEIVVKDPEDANKKEKCDIYGDIIWGLSISQLSRILMNDPIRKFIPVRD